MNTRPSQLIHYIIRSELAYLTIYDIRWLLSMMQPTVFESVVVWITGSLRPHVHFDVKVMKKHNSTTFRFTGESSGSIMSLPTTGQALNICYMRLYQVTVSKCTTLTHRFVSMPQHSLAYDWSSSVQETTHYISLFVLLQLQHSTVANPIQHWDTCGNIEFFGHNMRYGLRIRGKAGAFAGIWLKFRCTRNAWAHIHMADQLLHICQSQWTQSLSEQYWVHLLESETQAHLIVIQPQVFLAYNWGSGSLENPGHIVITDPAQHIFHPIWQ